MSGSDYILGISGLFHDSAAALTNNMGVVAAVQEERFTRRKHDSEFPRHAVDYCMSRLPQGAQIEHVAFYENPLSKLDRIYQNALVNAPRGGPIWRQTLETTKLLSNDLPEALLGIMDDLSKVHFVGHHRSHAASAYYPSKFDHAAVLVIDGVGEWSTTSIWQGHNSELQPLREITFPDSLGLFYSAFTQYCGFKVNSGEFKLMGLAPFGEPTFTQLLLDEVIDVKPDGSFALNLRYFRFHTDATSISPLLGYLLGQHALAPGDEITQHYCNVAASVQAVANQIVARLGATALQLTGASRLCMAGGVALNCVANSCLLKSLPDLQEIWIQPAAGDAGGALGAALEVAAARARDNGDGKRPVRIVREPMYHTYLGCEYDGTRMLDALTEQGQIFEIVRDDEALLERIAQALENQQIVGHFFGPMEFGPRALGNRSILADPRRPAMQGKVNKRIKFREGWRPLAPVVIAEKANRYFDEPTESPYMLFTSSLKQKFRGKTTLGDARRSGVHRLAEIQKSVGSEFNAVTHVDYTARLQTIDHATNPRLFGIIKKFAELTGCPMVLNTSFNVRGEPIVCTPKDAVSCFLNTNMDVLAMGSFLVYKSAQSGATRRKVGGKKFNAD